jgi:alkylation response protein AidB-like acyl-CoA dehydrogenase
LTIELAFDSAQQAIADAIGQFCRDRCPEEVVKAGAGKLSRQLWRELADLGVLALVTPEGDGEAIEMVAACEALGAAFFPGPVAHTFLATQLLDPSDRSGVTSGAELVSVGVPPLMPWAPLADRFIELDGQRAWIAAPKGAITQVDTLGREPWGRVELSRGAELDRVARGLVLYDIALAAYLTAAGRELVGRTSAHASTRRQFGRSLGEFQAVAHPLADCDMHLAASETLARRAAFEFDATRAEDASALLKLQFDAGVARLSATSASLEAAYVSHQLFGAVGITLEGPVFHASRRIRQLTSQAPGEASARAALLDRFGLQRSQS